MAPAFFPNDHTIPDRLRSRIGSWEETTPKTQFQQYGPFNAFLSIKFPPTAFLVKPQALLREMWTQDNMDDADLDALRAILLGGADDTMEVEDVNRRASLDSQGALHPGFENDRY
jgi:hypothetical protein